MIRDVTTGDWRPLLLKRDDLCIECGTALPAGVTASWSRARRAVRCCAHDDAAIEPPVPVADSGSSPEPDPVTPAAVQEPAALGGDWRALALKRAGACTDCGIEIPVGVTASWSRSQRAVRCLAHDLPVASALPVPPYARSRLDPPALSSSSTGTAGASALAEYERRAARREK